MPALARSVFITGCNRGIGLELVRQLLKLETPPLHIFATYRSPDTSGEDILSIISILLSIYIYIEELLALAQSNPALALVQMSVTDHDAYEQVVKRVTDVVGDEGLNLLINNAGLLPQNRDLQVRE